MSGKHVFRWGFLAVTAVAIGAELWASFDSSPATEPWTDLLTTYVPAPVTFGAIAVLVLWLPAHFAVRYAKRARERRTPPAE